MQLIVRDHDRKKFETRKDFLRRTADYLNTVWGAGSFELTVRDSYYNMKEKILPHMDLIENAQAAMRAADVAPRIVAIRGGTDGARLSWEGLPCPKDTMLDRADAAFCDPDDTAAARLMAEPCVSHMLEGLKELLRRAARAEEAADLQRELDRTQVRHDLRRMAWEKDFDEVSAQLESILCLLRDFLALPAESQALQLGTFRDAALEEVGKAEALLTKGREQA